MNVVAYSVTGSLTERQQHVTPKPTCSTGNSDVFMMFTVVYTPGGVCTLINVSLRTVTLNVVQPNLSTTDAVVIMCLRSDQPDSK